MSKSHGCKLREKLYSMVDVVSSELWKGNYCNSPVYNIGYSSARASYNSMGNDVNYIVQHTPFLKCSACLYSKRVVGQIEVIVYEWTPM